jgi:hypothetical protein
MGQTNHKYMTYNQLKSQLDLKNEQLDEQRLKILNLTKQNISLKNKNDDMHRLINTIANNDIARVNVLLKTCLKQNYDVSGIIDKLQFAINKVYKAKSCSVHEHK